MALSMSIANLDRSVRAQFDARIDRIQRRMQQEYRSRSIQQDNEEQQTADADNETSNDGELGITQGEIAPASYSQPNSDHEASEDATADSNTNHTSGQESQHTSRQPPSRTQSVDITVEYEEFAAAPAPTGDDNQSEATETLDQEINSLSGTGDRNLSCCEFYRRHWVGNLITGLFSGFLFILLGVIFLINGDDFPFYAGITLIVLGLAPCCMALNRYRYARLYERERRRALQRLNALRRAHRRNVREGRTRGQVYSDLPPSYDNLGFELNESDVEMDNFSVTTANGSFVLPTYDQFMKKSKLKQDKISNKAIQSDREKDDEYCQDEGHVPPPNYSESIGIVDDSPSRSEPQEYVQIAMPLDTIQIIETQHSENSPENSVDSALPSTDSQINTEDLSDETVVVTVHEQIENDDGRGNERNSRNEPTNTDVEELNVS